MRIFAFILLASLAARSQAPTTFAIQEHSGYSAQKDPGFLNDFIKALQKQGLKDIEFSYLPLKRALKEYLQTKNFDCFAGGDEKLAKFYGLPGDKIFSEPYITYSVGLFSSEKEICDVKELNGKTLAVIDDFPYQKVIKGVKLKDVIKAYNVDQAVKLAVNKRVDALMGYHPTNYDSLKTLKFCEQLVFIHAFGKFQCHSTPKGEAALKQINAAINALKENGELKRLLEKHFDDLLSKDYDILGIE